MGGPLILLTLLLAVIQLLLTWPLWTGECSYPQVPFFEAFAQIPTAWDSPLSYALVALITLQFFQESIVTNHHMTLSRFKALCRLLIIICWIALILLNQHRFQPWAYQILIWLMVVTITPKEKQALWILRFTASIYIFSAISKFDAAFVDHHGQQLLDGLLQSLRVTLPLSEAARWWMIFCFPLGELLIGMAMFFPRIRIWALIFSWMMHGSLLLALGPLGLNHQQPVLIWNLFFILQNGLLIRDLQRDKITENHEAWKMIRLSPIILWIWLFLPIGNFFDVLDLWPSWGLYAARSENVRFYLHSEEKPDVPNNLQPWIGPEPFDRPWCRVQLHQWSLKDLNAPPYPSARFALGTIQGLLYRLPADTRFLVIIEGVPDRFSGHRKTIELESRQQLDQYFATFLLNSQPRIHEFELWGFSPSLRHL